MGIFEIENTIFKYSGLHRFFRHAAICGLQRTLGLRHGRFWHKEHAENPRQIRFSIQFYADVAPLELVFPLQYHEKPFRRKLCYVLLGQHHITNTTASTDLAQKW